jgi:hypothetical protein
MFMNEQLMKMESSTESILKKIERQHQELTTGEGNENNSEDSVFKVEKVSIRDFLLKFRWSERSYPRNQQVQGLIKSIGDRVAQNDHIIRNAMQALQELRA